MYNPNYLFPEEEEPKSEVRYARISIGFESNRANTETKLRAIQSESGVTKIESGEKYPTVEYYSVHTSFLPENDASAVALLLDLLNRKYAPKESYIERDASIGYKH
ncbi:MAG: hypothetical protein A3E81_02450 [Gammaproteobacteria bacterium RIFCSPHIGHO2_12_FULL_36_30]|nr:MAG: hypothetical protein A3E81_02450 [Gammaproteobacteria bacterium RIFCSPHIGHO2_12_FULL_36_30]